MFHVEFWDGRGDDRNRAVGLGWAGAVVGAEKVDMYVSNNTGLTGVGQVQGLGQISFPDLSGLTWEDYLLMGIGGIVAYKLFTSAKQKVKRASGKRRSRAKKREEAQKVLGGGGLGSEFTILLVIGAAAIGYLYFQGQGSGG